MAVWVKICGMTCPDDARAAWDAGADAIGLNFVGGPRRITLHQALPIMQTRPTGGSLVALLDLHAADTPPDLLHALGANGVRHCQVYGAASPEHVAGLIAAGWQVLPVCRAARGALANALAPWLTVGSNTTPFALLLDSYHPGRAGGTGMTLDWTEAGQAISAAQARGAPNIVLAGGLTPDNVEQAIRMSRPWGVDVASGVEIEVARKDPEKMAAFVREAKAAL